MRIENDEGYMLHDDDHSTDGSHTGSRMRSNVIFEMKRSYFICLLVTFALLILGCVTMLVLLIARKPGNHSDSYGLFSQLGRTGQEIMVCGELYNIGTRVVLWTDPGGYDAYRTQLRFVPYNISDISFWPNVTLDRYNLRYPSWFTDADVEEVRGGGWPLPLLTQVIDQFVLHFDQVGYSKQTFEILQDVRGLSIHFMLDVDGTIYQTLDVKEMARHATISNNRSIGIEIANIGAYQTSDNFNFSQWYTTDSSGHTIMTLPPDNWVYTPNFVGSPSEPNPIQGVIQGQDLFQYDYTPQQYAALAKLTTMLCKLFPLIKPDYPKDANGRLINHVLTDQQWTAYEGIMGHYHIQLNKIDPGPAFNWDRLMTDVHSLLTNNS